MNRAMIMRLVIKYLNEQDDFSMSYEKLSAQFEAEGANFDVALIRMDGVEVAWKGMDVTLNEPYRAKRSSRATRFVETKETKGVRA